MVLLLDTHTLIWFLNGNKELSTTARKAIENPENEKLVSITTLWEIAVKMSLGKFEFNGGLKKLANMIADNGFTLLPIIFEDILKVASLEFIHRDPIDRLLVAQALTNKLVIVTKDQFVKQYKVKTVW